MNLTDILRIRQVAFKLRVVLKLDGVRLKRPLGLYINVVKQTKKLYKKDNRELPAKSFLVKLIFLCVFFSYPILDSNRYPNENLGR